MGVWTRKNYYWLMDLQLLSEHFLHFTSNWIVLKWQWTTYQCNLRISSDAKSPTGACPNRVIFGCFWCGENDFPYRDVCWYKGGRAKTPDEFQWAISLHRELLDHLGIRHYELAQYEADDIIGTLGRLAEKESFDVTIVSGDKRLNSVDGWTYGSWDF